MIGRRRELWRVAERVAWDSQLDTGTHDVHEKEDWTGLGYSLLRRFARRFTRI